MRTFGQKLCQESGSEEGEEQEKEGGFLIGEKIAVPSLLAKSFSPKALSWDHLAWGDCAIKLDADTFTVL